MSDEIREATHLRFLSPIDGDVLFEELDGEVTREQTLHAAERDFWVDTKENIIFVKDDIILNSHRPQKIKPYLDRYLTRKDRAFMYLLIHEQYFYPHDRHYLPDFRERLLAGVEWCEEHGYRSSWISDFAFEKKE